jgi:hypothetical protein
LSLVTSRCGHVEFRAGFGKRWCACQRGCALLSESWAGEGVEYGGIMMSAGSRLPSALYCSAMKLDVPPGQPQ